MPCWPLPRRAPASGWWISAVVVARPRWSLRAPSAPLAAWQGSVFPVRWWRGGGRRGTTAGIANVDWRQADPAVAALDEYDLLTSAFGVMFFGDRVAAFTNMRRSAAPDARMALVCWRTLAENPWMEVPMTAVARPLPPRPKAVPNAPGMFAFADPEHVTEVLTAAGWTPPRFETLDMDLDFAAGRGLEQAVIQSAEIGAVNSWLR